MGRRGVCGTCKSPFRGKRSDAIYCSTGCRVTANDRAKRDRLITMIHDLAERDDALQLAISIMDRKQRAEFEKRRARRRSRQSMSA